MRPALSVFEVRAAEQEAMAALPAGTLMARAAFGIATVAADLLRERAGRVPGARVLLLVGSGDNGADALWAGVHLARRGCSVSAVLTDADRTGARADGVLPAFLSSGGTVVAAGAAAGLVALVVDGLTGIGARGPLRHPSLASLAGQCREAGALVLSVDVPSGVLADSGAVPGEAVQADVTVVPGVRKAVHLAGAGRPLCGEVRVLDIGLELGAARALAAVDAEDLLAGLPDLGSQATKYTRGVLGLVSGSAGYSGAAVLSCGGAVRGAAGMVRFVSTGAAARAVRTAHPEVVVTEIDPGDTGALLGAGRVQAWAIGPGLGVDPAGLALVRAVLGTDLPVLLDADALTLCGQHPSLLRREAPTLLTPHLGEFTRVTGVGVEEVAADRIGVVRGEAARLGVTILLKGSETVVAAPDGRVRVADAGTSWLGTAGSGDVLTGLAGSLLAGGLEPLAAGVLAAFWHGRAGALLEPPITSADLPRALPLALREIRRSA